MAEWWNGGMANGNRMAESRNGGLVIEWRNGGMAEWRIVGMAEWRNGNRMAEWQNGNRIAEWWKGVAESRRSNGGNG